MRIDVAVETIDTVEYAVCCEALSEFGGRQTSAGGCWTLELADAMSGARDAHYAFFVVVGGQRVDLVADALADGEPYLRPAAPGAGYARPVSPR